MSLTVLTSRSDDACVVRVAGEVDVSNAPELRAAIDEALASHAVRVEANLADASYIDSTGIGVLVGAAHRAADQGVSFVVTEPQRNVARVLAMLGVDKELGVKAQS